MSSPRQEAHANPCTLVQTVRCGAQAFPLLEVDHALVAECRQRDCIRVRRLFVQRGSQWVRMRPIVFSFLLDLIPCLSVLLYRIYRGM